MRPELPDSLVKLLWHKMHVKKTDEGKVRHEFSYNILLEREASPYYSLPIKGATKDA